MVQQTDLSVADFTDNSETVTNTAKFIEKMVSVYIYSYTHRPRNYMTDCDMLFLSICTLISVSLTGKCKDKMIYKHFCLTTFNNS